jgi:ATP-dependent RNA helicase DDX5/DBP2
MHHWCIWTHQLLQRAGLTGISYTYFTTENAKSARELINILREAKNEVPPQLEEMAMYSGGGGGRSESRD